MVLSIRDTNGQSVYCAAKDAMRRGISPVIIDNTNTKCHEMKPYVAAVSTCI